MLAQLIKQPLTKSTINEILEVIGDSQELFDELMTYFLGNNARVTQLTSWAVGHIGEKQPQLIRSYHQDLLAQLQRNDRHNAIRRNIVRLYQFAEIPEDIEGKLYDICIGFILNPKEAIAVRAFSMRVCERIALLHPALIEELIAVVETTIPNGSSGLKNRASHVINHLRKASTQTKHS